MTGEAAFETMEVTVGSHRVTCYAAGSGDEVVLCLNGGPGLPCNYLRDPMRRLVDHGYRVIAFDQLGTGESDRVDDAGLWNIERYATEVETVRTSLDLDRIHLLGHSWGGWLSLEYCASHLDNLASLILLNTCADMPHLVSELNRLRAALGTETQAMLLRHEAEQSWNHPEYQSAITLLNYRHVCRLPEWPESLKYSLANSTREIYVTMQGPNEFHYVGNLKDWCRLEQLARVQVPVFIGVGQHDEITPACAARMQAAAPHAELRVFQNSSHMPFYEEPEAFFAALTDFMHRSTRQPAMRVTGSR